MKTKQSKGQSMMRPQSRPVQISATVFGALSDYCWQNELNMARIVEQAVLDRARWCIDNLEAL